MKLLKIKRKIFFGCAVFLFLASCEQDQIGPDLVAASSEFKKAFRYIYSIKHNVWSEDYVHN